MFCKLRGSLGQSNENPHHLVSGGHWLSFFPAVALALLSTGEVGSYVASGHNARGGPFQQNGALAGTLELKC